MKKTLLLMAVMLVLSQSMMAVKPIVTEGYDLYKNNFKLDVTSIFVLSPHIEWEHYTGTRFSYGAYAQAYVTNRSSFSTQFESREVAPTDVVLHGRHYDVDWSNSPGRMYGEIQMDGETHEVRWDRRYTGVFFGPEGRMYVGRKPNRGFYFMAKAGFGIFRESFDLFYTKVSMEEKSRRRDAYNEAKAAGQTYEYPSDHNEWALGGNQKSDFKYAVSGAFGMGCQGWFEQNSHWGFDVHAVVKGTYGTVDREDHSLWEWFIGPAFPYDMNISLLYRF